MYRSIEDSKIMIMKILAKIGEFLGSWVLGIFLSIVLTVDSQFGCSPRGGFSSEIGSNEKKKG